MKRLLSVLWLAAMTTLPFSSAAEAQRAKYDALVATHAKTFAVPEALVHRVIVRESRYQPDLVGRGGTIGLMQIKLPTARGMGYTGDAAGLRDPNTNLLYGVKYLAGAYRAANGDHDRAVRYYASGYYGVAKQPRGERRILKEPGAMLASAPPKDAAEPLDAKPEEAAKAEEIAKPVESAKLTDSAAAANGSAIPKEIVATPKHHVPPKVAVAKRKKELRKKLVEAGEPVLRPPASVPGANGAKPR
jgi:hypothetical protein